MHKEIILSLNLFKNNNHDISVSYYCNIPDIKEGYMYLSLGKTSQEDAFWTGLYKVLAALGSYKMNYAITLGFSKLLLELKGDEKKDKSLKLLKEFKQINYMDMDTFQHDLIVMNKMCLKKGIQQGTLFGLNMSEYKKEQNKSSKKTTNKINTPLNYYSGLQMPSYGVVVDFESTSPLPEFARIIEISALKFKGGLIIDEFRTLVNPGMKVPKKIRTLTGITQEEIDAAPNSFYAIKQFLNFIKDTNIMVAHNIAYDFALLDNFCSRFNFPKWTGELLCTYKLAKSAQINIENYKLETLCECFKIDNPSAHRAWSDTRATFHLMKALFENTLLV